MIYRALGQKLRSLRQRNKYSQQHIAQHLGVTYQQVQKYERGTNRIPLDALARIRNLYNLSWDDLLSDFSV